MRAAVVMTLTLASLCGCDGCGEGNFDSLVPVIAPSTTNVTFGEVFVGFTGDGTLTVTNVGSAPLTVSGIAVEGEGFSIAGELAEPTIGVDATFGLDLRFTPPAAGSFTGQLLITSDAANRPVLVVRLAGEGLLPLDCDDGDPCTANRFDPEEGSCVTTALSDVSCGEDDACIDDGLCINGACVGSPVSCAAPESPCRIGICDGEMGCVQVDNPTACDDDDPCTVDVCDATLGCSHEPVVDGTPCGPFGGCDSVPICLGGVCTDTPVPDGTLCIDGDACTTGDRCVAGECVGDTADSEVTLVGRARSYGAAGAEVVAVTDTRLAFYDRGFGEAWMTVVDVVDGQLEVRLQDLFDAPVDRQLFRVDDFMLVALHREGAELRLERIVVGPMGGFYINGELGFTLPPVVGEPVQIGERLSVAAAGNRVFVCDERSPAVGIIDIGQTQPAFIEAVPLLSSMACADLAVAPGGDLVVASQMLRELPADQPGPGLMSRWSLDDTGAAPAMELLATYVFGGDACSGFGEQPRHLAVTDDGLVVVGCGIGYIGGGVSLASSLYVMPPNLSTATLAPISYSVGNGNGDLVAVGPEVALFNRLAGQLIQLCRWDVVEGTQTCSPALKRVGGLRFAARGALAAFPSQNGAYVVVGTDPFTPVTGLGHGSQGALLGTTAGVYSVSRHGAHRITPSAAGLTIVDSGVERTGGPDGYALVSVGPQGSAPWQVLGVGNAALYDVSLPSAPAVVGGNALLGRSAAAVGEQIVSLDDDGVTVTSEAPTATGFSSATLGFPLILGDADRTHALVRADDERAILALPTGPGSSLLLVVDTVPSPHLTATLPHARPVDVALHDDQVLMLRGQVVPFTSVESPDDEGELARFRLVDGALVPAGAVSTPNANAIVSFDGGLALVSAGSELIWIQPLGDELVVVDAVNVGGTIVDARVSGDVLYVSTGAAVASYSPPCPPAASP